MLPATAARVPAATADSVNRRIRQQMQDSLAYFAMRPDEIDRRLSELDREWDVERVLETNASALALTGVALGYAVDRRFLLLPAVVLAFLLQHALQGWCPPLPVLRRAGVRTAQEIEQERYALKAMRGDFATPPPADAPAWDRASGHAQAVRK